LNSSNSIKRVFATLTLLFTALPAFATTKTTACVTSGMKTALSHPEGAAPAPVQGDLNAFNEAVPVIPNGVVDYPVQDQQCADDCWAWGENGLATAMHQKATGNVVLSSADHSAFWHYYFQIFYHGNYYESLSKKVHAGKMTLQQAVDEAILMMHTLPGSTTARAAGYTLQPGSVESTALWETQKVGLMPASVYSHPITTVKESSALTASLKGLIAQVITNPGQMAQFKTMDPDGINTPLYNLCVKELAPYFQGASADHPPFRPGDTFVWNGSNYTPLSWMANGIGFDPTAWTMVTKTPQNAALIEQAIQESLKAQIPVPIGFMIYNQLAAQKAGTWSMDLFANGTKPVLAGGHEVIISNAKAVGVPTGPVQGKVIRNSWGLQGLDANGAQPASPALSGYNGITQAYENFTLQQGEPSNFVFSNAFIAANPQFKTLLQAAPTQARRIQIPRSP
jgi:hypothetical protein